MRAGDSIDSALFANTDSTPAGRSGRSPAALLRQTAAGAAAGFVVFVLLELGYQGAPWHRGELFGVSEHQLLPESLSYFPGFALFLPGILFAAIVTAALVAADEYWSGDPKRIVRRSSASAAMATVLGAGYSVIGHATFDSLSEMFGYMLPGYGNAVARGVSWSFFGLGVGLSAGLASRSMQRAYHGCAGGLLGGFAGGLLFSLFGAAFENGTLSRLVGFVVLAACVGFATALVEQLTRTAWLTFLSGSREGRQVALYSGEIVLGRDELADVPLFGDNEVERRHALLSLEPEPAVREVAARSLLRVDGLPVRAATLRDGAVIQIGSHRLRFRNRKGGAAAASFPSPIAAMFVDPVSDTGELSMPGVEDHTIVPLAGSAGLLLRVIGGNSSGAELHVHDREITVGRDDENALVVDDRKVSRYHVRIVPCQEHWVLQDLESTNGTRLNGTFVRKAGLAAGDFLYIGDTAIAVLPGEQAAVEVSEERATFLSG